MKTPLSKFQIISLGAIFLLYGLLVTKKINLVTADLGRHLKNGEIFFQTFSVPRINLYSYTFPDFPFLNHHWASGVVFFTVFKLGGFVGLSLFFTLISLLTFWLFFDLAQKNSRLSLAIFSAVLALPVIVTRGEIRPEVFSYFLTGLFYWIIRQVNQQKLSLKWLWLLPVLELAWINLHIYFFLGFLIMGVFILNALINKSLKHSKKLALSLAKVMGLSAVLILLNPNGINGVLYPLKIFNNFGYRLFENQSVWFLTRIVNYPPSLYFLIVFVFLVASWLFVVIRRQPISWVNLAFFGFFSAIAWTAVRNFTLFGYFALPILATNLKAFFSKKKETEIEYFAAASLAALTLFGLFMLNSSYWLAKIDLGVGLKKGNLKAGEFFQKQEIKGPVFNNYDNGGYLIYALYPGEKVFVDNRPEAYPAEFFQKTYIAMQESDKRWQEVDKEYNFNTIFFYRHDLTPWGQNFLVNRIQDSSWAPIFVDDWSIIFLKRNERNTEIIKRFELPKEMFSVKK